RSEVKLGPPVAPAGTNGHCHRGYTEAIRTRKSMSSMRQCLAMTAGRALRGAPICLPTALGKARGRGRRWVKQNQAKARFFLSELEHSNRGGERADHLGQRRVCAAQGMGFSPTYSVPWRCSLPALKVGLCRAS